MARSRRCCCCNDVYWGNDDGVVAQFHLAPPSLTPKQSHSLSNSYLSAVDYRNKRVIVRGLIGTTPTLFYTRTEQLQSPVPIGTTQVFGNASWNVAVDWTRNRIFYAAERDVGPNKYSFRGVDLNGANDVEIATEDYTASVSQFPVHTLQYDPLGDKLYYTRVNSVAGTQSIELRSMNSDGTNQQTVCTLGSAASPGSVALRGNFVVPSQGITIAVVRFNATNETRMSLITIAGGAAFTVKSSVTTDGSFPISNPQYCYKDGNIYFLSFLNSIGGTGDKRASMHRINPGGSGEEVVFSFADWTGQNLYHWSGWTQGTLLRLGCGMEKTGASYSGVG